MGFILLPVIVFSFFMGIFAIDRTLTQDILPSAMTLQAKQNGQTFVAYRNAVSIYQQNNPTFTGTVSSAALAAQGTTFSSGFLALASNVITAVGATGRVITCYASLPGGSISEALAITENDASLGTALGTLWVSAGDGLTSTSLATAVPDGNVVSVVQIGN